MRRLFGGFAGRTYHIVGNLMSRLNINEIRLAECELINHEETKYGTFSVLSLILSLEADLTDTLEPVTSS